MQKLQLRLDDLQVQSFETSDAVAQARGTVRGREQSNPNCTAECTGFDSCQETCEGVSCDGAASCRDTCAWQTCDPSNYMTCWCGVGGDSDGCWGGGTFFASRC